jgi:hypothetical protein
MVLFMIENKHKGTVLQCVRTEEPSLCVLVFVFC